MAVALGGVIGDLAGLIPSSSDILQQVIIGAGASVVLSGLKTNAGMDAVDPLHIFHHPAVPATPTAPAQAATASVVVGKTINSSAFAGLTPAVQDRLMSQGYTIVPG